MAWIAHRGGAGLRMENTLAAFAHAIELGAAGAELDVHLSRDGEVIVHHDASPNPAYCRDADGNWIAETPRVPFADLDWSEIHRFDISAPRPGSGYAKRHEALVVVPDQRIPLLREVIDLVRARAADFRLIIEIKVDMAAAAQQLWRPVLDAVLAILRDADFIGRATLCSFDWGALIAARTMYPELPTWFTSLPLSWFGTDEVPAGDLRPDPWERRALCAARGHDAPWYAGFDPRRFGGSFPRAVAAAGGSAWFPWNRDFTAAAARESAALDLDTTAWTSNLRDVAELSRLHAAGLHYPVLDYPPDPATGFNVP